MKAWKRLAEGQYVDLYNLSLRDINIVDINRSLNKIIRFNGHYKDKEPLTVAQHTYLCLELAKILFPNENKIHRAVILHDFGEAYLGDITTQVKALLGEAYRNLAKEVDNLIYKKFWPYLGEKNPDNSIKASVKVCDYLSLDIERRSMWKSQLGKDKWPDTVEGLFSLKEKETMFDRVQAMSWVDLEQLLEEN